MAISRDSAKDAGNATPTGTTVQIATPSGGYGVGKLLISACISGIDPAGLSIDNSFTIARTIDQFAVCGLAIAYKYNSTGSEANITWTAGSSTGLYASAFQYSGALTASALDKNPTGTHSNGVQVATLAGPATGTLAQADELIITFLGVVGDLASPSCAGGGSVIHNQSNRLVAIEQIVAATTSITHTPSWTNNNYADVGTLSFKAAEVAAQSPWIST